MKQQTKARKSVWLRSLGLGLAALTAANPGAHAAEATTLSIGDAVARALDQNPDVQKARAAVRQSSQDTKVAISKALPQISGTASATHLKPATSAANSTFRGLDYNQYQAGLSLDQAVYDSALWPGYKYQKQQEVIQELNLRVAERTVTESVVEAFYSVLLSQHLGDILRETLKVDQDTLATAERYLKIGRAQEIDVLQLRTQTALITPKIAQADDNAKIAAAQLATLIRETKADVHAKGDFPIPDHQWVEKTAAEKAAELPEVLAAKETTKQFEYTKDINLAVYNPKLGVVGQYARQAYSGTGPNLNIPANTTWSVGLQLSVPIFAGLGSVYEKKSLAEQGTQVALNEAKVTDTEAVTRVQSETDFQVARAQLDSAKLAAEYGRKSIAEAKRLFRLQTISYLQYQSSAQAFLDSETGFFQAQYNYIVAAAKYLNAVGVPSGELVQKLAELDRGIQR